MARTAIEQGVVGDPAAVGKQIRIGRIESVTPTQMIVRTDNGQDIFDRAP